MMKILLNFLSQPQPRLLSFSRLSTLIIPCRNNICSTPSPCSHQPEPQLKDQEIKLGKTSMSVDLNEVGITEFVGGPPKLNGIVKQSNTDFHVHEIDLDGQIVRLTDINEIPNPIPHTDDIFALYYTHCTMFKVGRSWVEALHYICRHLRVKSKHVACAGMKDKRSCSSQRISILNVDSHRLAKFNKKSQYLKLGNFSYSLNELSIGHLKGNHFTILLRDLKSVQSSSSICSDFQSAIKILSQIGFINYYGPQRFGSGPSSSHVIGKAFLQANWDQVFHRFLLPQERDSAIIKILKSTWASTHDPVATLKSLPRNLGKLDTSIEVCLLRDLKKHFNGVDYSQNTTRTMRTLPNSYRKIFYMGIVSFLWNHLVNFRLQKFGLKPITGDVVGVKSKSKSMSESQEQFDRIQIKNPDLNQPGLNQMEMNVKTLMDEDECADYTIYDVFLQLPSAEFSSYSNPILQEFYLKLLQQNQLDSKCFIEFEKMYRTPMKGGHTCITYRPLLVKPINIKYKMFSYFKDDLDSIIPSDWDLVKSTNVGQVDGVDNSVQDYFCGVGAHHNFNLSQQHKVGAVVEFSLPSSSYATMALRQILHDQSTY